jgi:hypothetical protein
MKVREHEWEDHGRWRQCLHCGQKQYLTSRIERVMSPTGGTRASHWLPAEPGSCVGMRGRPRDGPTKSGG